MSRRRAAIKRKILPDARFNNFIIAKFINCLMTRGKKSVAEKALYKALEAIEKKEKINALEYFLEAIENVKPLIEVRSRRVGGATYQVPVEVRSERRLSLAIKWIIISARKRNEKSIQSRLSAELIDAFHKRGAAFKKREDTHKMAEANKAFSHFRW